MCNRFIETFYQDVYINLLHMIVFLSMYVMYKLFYLTLDGFSAIVPNACAFSCKRSFWMSSLSRV